jgi:hypothetical protein
VLRVYSLSCYYVFAAVLWNSDIELIIMLYCMVLILFIRVMNVHIYIYMHVFESGHHNWPGPIQPLALVMARE